jgi:hypothetical protein
MQEICMSASPQRAGLMRHPQALGQQKPEPIAEPLAPMAQVGVVGREGVLRTLSPVKYWKYGS